MFDNFIICYISIFVFLFYFLLYVCVYVFVSTWTVNKDVYKTPAAKMFACTLEAPDGLSWNLFGAKFGGGGMAPLAH